MKREWKTTLVWATNPDDPTPPDDRDGWRLVGVANAFSADPNAYERERIALFWEREEARP